jgi:hypothetical protein
MGKGAEGNLHPDSTFKQILQRRGKADLFLCDASNKENRDFERDFRRM